MGHERITEEVLRQRVRVNVRRFRQAEGLTLKVASQRAELHWRHWQKLEAGEVNLTIATLVRVASALRVDPTMLLDEPNGEPPTGSQGAALLCATPSSRAVGRRRLGPLAAAERSEVARRDRGDGAAYAHAPPSDRARRL
jgi:transcriptional regulator with XRE-family HTH domain